jgi:23S rRNA (adenine2503-C2)-methyltransferase
MSTCLHKSSQGEFSRFLDENNRINLLGMPKKIMDDFFVSIGQKPFRSQQVLKWMHQLGVSDFSKMTNLSKALREDLSRIASITPPDIVSQHDSSDGTRKWVVKVTGGSCVETVYIPDNGRGTLCVSSQVGCSLDCSFCSTGKQGFQRDLTAAEVIGQVWLAIKSFDAFDTKKARVVTNVVMMGMGEPLLNFDNVVDAMSLMLNDMAYGLSKRRVTLSTSGVVPNIYKLSQHSEVSLALSLHAPTDELRNELVPINKKYPIAEVLQACKDYMASMSDTKRVTTVEYTLIDGVNDSEEQAHQLAKVLKDFPCKINLIPFNPFDLVDYKRPSNNRIYRFQTVLLEAGFIVTKRTTRGDDIDAACGQLVGNVEDKTKRRKRYEALKDNKDNKDNKDIQVIKWEK